MVFQKFLLSYYKHLSKDAKSANTTGRIILYQVKKVLACHFPTLSQQVSELSDSRSRKEYRIEELILGGVMLFLFKSVSRNEFDNKRKDTGFVKNYFNVFGLRLPSTEAIDDLFKILCNDALEALKGHLLSALIEKKVFHRFRFLGLWTVAVDATGVYNWDENPVDFALHKTSKCGKTTWFSNILEAKLVTTTGLSIPLASEWIYNGEDDYQKQDCEQSAFKRLAVTLKKRFPRLPLCILVDGLYPNAPFMDICKNNGWRYIAVLKDGNLPTVWEEVGLLPGCAFSHQTQQYATTTHQITLKYKWVKDIDWQKRKLNWVECIQTKVHIKTGEQSETKFVYITDCDVNRDNIIQFVEHARSRWHIEDSFNTQKNRGYELHHKFNRKNFTSIKNWHSVRLIAHTINQLIEKSQQFKDLLVDKETIKNLWEDFRSFFLIAEIGSTIIEQMNHIENERMQIRLC